MFSCFLFVLCFVVKSSMLFHLDWHQINSEASWPGKKCYNELQMNRWHVFCESHEFQSWIVKQTVIEIWTYFHTEKNLSIRAGSYIQCHWKLRLWPWTLNIYITDTIFEAMDKKRLTALFRKHLTVLIIQNCLTNFWWWVPHLLLSNSFKSYLSGRSRSTRIASTLYDPLQITLGVPQGAILSPLLFCTYLNDLPFAPQTCCLESYVDDSKVFLSFPLLFLDIDSAVWKLEDDLCNVATWCCDNNLLI